MHPSTLVEEQYPHCENVSHIHSAMGNLKAQMIKIKGREDYARIGDKEVLEKSLNKCIYNLRVKKTFPKG